MTELYFPQTAYECPTCHGEGFVSAYLCDECNGTGKIIIDPPDSHVNWFRVIAWIALIGIDATLFLLVGRALRMWLR